MRFQARYRWFAMLALCLLSTGCCCIQGMPGQCGPCGGCGMGPLASCQACAGGCGDTYVDEWVSDPPCVDQCCAGDVRPVRSLLRTLWGSRFVQGYDACGCGGGCDSCDGSCGYASAGGSGCTSCGGGGAPGGCSSCGGGVTVTEPMMHSSSQHKSMPHQHMAQDDEPRMVPGSYKVSAPRRVPASVASERINPARQKMDTRRASYSN